VPGRLSRALSALRGRFESWGVLVRPLCLDSRAPWLFRREKCPSAESDCAGEIIPPPEWRPRPVRAAAPLGFRTGCAGRAGTTPARSASRSRTAERDPRRARRDGD
jgi:hypothetical protein